MIPKTYKPKVPKDKKCGWSKCGKMFTPSPFTFNQKTCFNSMCAIGYNTEKQAIKEAKINDRFKNLDKESLKTWSDHIQELQKLFNQFIRMRDLGLPCISCGTTKNVEYHAGHYIPAGNYGFLRFNELNVNRQCGKNCNKERHGNVHEYRDGLIKKIGIEKVLWLEANRHNNLELSIPEIIELKIKYKQKIKELR